MRPLRAFVFIALCSLAWGQSRGGDELAPDGRRGFGSEVELRDLLKQFRTPNDDQLAFHLELVSLGLDVGVLIDVTEGSYRDRGYFELLDPLEDQTLENLHRTYLKYEQDPSAVATRPQRIGRAFVQMFFNTRFRVRLKLIEHWQAEREQVRAALAVFSGAARGYVTLDDAQANNLAKRLDLSAAVLRSMRSDLESLREPLKTSGDSDVGPQRVAEFLELFDIGDRGVREDSLARVLEREEVNEARMRSVLFTDRLHAQEAESFKWRSIADSEARELYARAYEATPDRDGSDDVPREVSKLSKSRRRKLARENSIKGLTFDPLDPELAWLAGVMSSFVFGELETASHFDRFLVLHRISYIDHATYEGRELTERERIALKYIQELDRRAAGGTGQ